MRYRNIKVARFLDRPNRFIAHVEVEGKTETVHVKNTGRCRELLVPGARVYLEGSRNPARKTAWDLVAVEKGERLINMDSQAPNKVFAEWALDLVEVKGVTLEEDGAVYFPDAPTERGVKHLHELTGAALAGIDATVFFVVQLEGAKFLSPNDSTHPAFGEALRQAAQSGVHVRAFDCTVTPDTLSIRREVPVIL